MFFGLIIEYFELFKDAGYDSGAGRILIVLVALISLGRTLMACTAESQEMRHVQAWPSEKDGWPSEKTAVPNSVSDSKESQAFPPMP